MERMEEFRERFNFRKELSLHLGVEREAFLVNALGEIVPMAPRVLKYLAPHNDRFGYELSACQLEDRVGPCRPERLKDSFRENEDLLHHAERVVGFRRSFESVGPENIPLDIYPDPTGRYQEIVKTLPRSVLQAACRVIGVHVHVGMPDHERALKVYNQVITHTETFTKAGDTSCGTRLALYKLMASDWMPRPYRDWEEYYETACEQGFVFDPRRSWSLIRISVHGTIEFRMFGATPHIPTIIGWAKMCHHVCANALRKF